VGDRGARGGSGGHRMIHLGVEGYDQDVLYRVDNEGQAGLFLEIFCAKTACAFIQPAPPRHRP
jgi:hypothetical protein